MIDLLGIINARDFHEGAQEDIRIINNNKSPYIEYQKNTSEDSKIINTINKIDPQLARASDLEYLLKNRCWNTPERKFIDCNKNLCILKEDSTVEYIPTIINTEISGGYIIGKNGEEKIGTIIPRFSPNTTEIEDDLGDIQEKSTKQLSPIEYTRKLVSKFRAIESKKKREHSITEDTLYNILTRNKDKMSGGVVDLICSGSGTYTNIINLNYFLEIKDNKIDGFQKLLVKLGINFTKNIKGIPTIYNKEFSFYPFLFTLESSTKKIKAISDNFVYEIDDNVIVEYMNGCIRVFPVDKDIIECIINFCYLNYE